jgi:hypothetical protein
VEQRKWRIYDFLLGVDESNKCSDHCLDTGLGQGNSAHVMECQQDKHSIYKTQQALRKSLEYVSSLRFLHDEAILNSSRQDVFRRFWKISELARVIYTIHVYIN